MKKNWLKISLIIIALLFINIKVNAATCDNSTKKALKKEAQQVNITAELQKPSTDPGADNTIYSYDVRVLNVSNNMTYEIGSWIYQYSDAVDGEIYVKNAYLMGGYRVSIVITASNKTACSGEVLRTVYVNLPRYNIYSDRKECEGLSEYAICKRTANTENVDESEFIKRVEQAKKQKIEEEKEKPKEEEKEKTIDKLINFFQENKNIIIPIAVILSVLIIILVIIKTRKNKNKVKIDLGGDL